MTCIFINVELKVTAAAIHFRPELLSILVLQQTKESQSVDPHCNHSAAALEHLSITRESMCSITVP